MELALKKHMMQSLNRKSLSLSELVPLSGGPFANHEQVRSGVDAILPVDLYIPGCPPHPLTILDGLLRLLNRLDKQT
jgi:NADH:ubiquinone oxidoreductase subunit B-like Fe-S oxidoreductase